MALLFGSGGNACSLDIPSFSKANCPTYGSAGLALSNGLVDCSNGYLTMTLQPPQASDPLTGLNTLLSTSQSMLYGTVEASIRQGPIGGVVTAFTLINDNTKDEIDFEWIGNERDKVWTNFFYRGRRERDPVTRSEVFSSHQSVSSDTNENFHDYKIEWTPYAITWSVDGGVVKVWNKGDTWELAGTGDQMPYDHYHYPDTPLLITFGIWNDNDKVWSNGPVDWEAAPKTGYTADIRSVKITCYQGPYPSNPNAAPDDPASHDTAGQGPGDPSPTNITGGSFNVSVLPSSHPFTVPTNVVVSTAPPATSGAPSTVTGGSSANPATTKSAGVNGGSIRVGSAWTSIFVISIIAGGMLFL